MKHVQILGEGASQLLCKSWTLEISTSLPVMQSITTLKIPSPTKPTTRRAIINIVPRPPKKSSVSEIQSNASSNQLKSAPRSKDQDVLGSWNSGGGGQLEMLSPHCCHMDSQQRMTNTTSLQHTPIHTQTHWTATIAVAKTRVSSLKVDGEVVYHLFFCVYQFNWNGRFFFM